MNIMLPQKIRAVLTSEQIDVIEDAPCTCSNPEPGDWPHDPNNTECYRRRLVEALQKVK